jgi:hypothetical protein
MITAFLGIETGSTPVDAAIVSGIVAVTLAILRALGILMVAGQDRRRKLYAEAYEAAMAWGEMVHRVRRRGQGEDAERALVNQFHELQLKLDYYQGWTATEGKYLCRSYCRFVNEIKTKAEPLIAAARSKPGQSLSEPTEKGAQLDLREESDRFLRDVRGQLSLFWFPRLGVVWRNRSSQDNTYKGSTR